MTVFKLTLYFLLLVYFCFLTYSLATEYQKNETRNRVSFFIWVVDTINLFIHEAGHFFFSFMGRFIYFLGGSLLQVIIPIAAIIVFARTSLRSIPFTFYWTGQSLVNLSIYIGDAPYQRLRLISPAATHDWRWLLNYLGIIEYAEDIAGFINIFGLVICCTGIGIGFYFCTRDLIQLLSTTKSEQTL